MTSDVLSRRDMLKGVVQTAALATFVPASALGRDGAPPPSERLSLGAIGVGARGFPDMRSFARMQDVRVTALCDVNQRNIQRAREFLAGQYGRDDVRIFKDFHEAAEDNKRLEPRPHRGAFQLPKTGRTD